MSKERFNIEEAILHAKEVAEKNRRAYKNCPAELNTKGYTCEQCADEHEQLAKWLEELKQYRDLEEQGLLLRLPCRVEDTVYIPYSRPKYIKKAVVKEFLFDGVDFHVQTDFVTFSLRDVNTTVFLAQSEAEEKLRELEKQNG